MKASALTSAVDWCSLALLCSSGSVMTCPKIKHGGLTTSREGYSIAQTTVAQQHSVLTFRDLMLPQEIHSGSGNVMVQRARVGLIRLAQHQLRVLPHHSQRQHRVQVLH